MRALTTAELLEVWERGLHQQPIERALEILRAARAGGSLDEVAGFSVGQRDGLLLTLREWIFGPQLNAVVACVACREKLDLNFQAADLRRDVGPPAAAKVSVNGYDLQLRPVTSADLLAVLQANAAESRTALLGRSIVSAQKSGEPVSLEALPAEVIAAGLERLEASDPQADIQIALVCPSCGKRQRAPFDIVGFFWSEIEAWSVRILREVHTLASAYGWREADILALSPARRECYLGMAGA